ncbi:MAG: glycoside hydrolase family 31 protein [Bacilli bacterium]
MYDLGKQFHIDTSKAVAKKEAIILGRTYRFTVLTERLIRLQYSPKGVFCDAPSELAIFRDFPVPLYELKQDEKFLMIKTKYFQLDYTKEKPFDAGKIVPMNNLKVTLLSTDKVWYYQHPEVRNYGGLFTAFDGNKSNQEIQKGLYSLDGFSSIDDSKTMLIDSNGNLSKRVDDNIDIYLFMYHDDFRLGLQDYFTLTGQPPLIPRYALGNWWCKNTEYNSSTLLELANDFKKHDIPVGVVLLDKPWHLREVTDSKGKKIKLKTGYTFNKDLFSDSADIIKKLHEMNIRVGLNVNPQDGIYPIEELYQTAAAYLKVVEPNVIMFDPLNPVFMDVYMKVFLHSLEGKGIDFFWNDYEKVSRNANDLDLLNYYHFLDIKRTPDKRGMLLSRPSDIAPHRYPISYSGKTEATWETLKQLPLLNQRAANVGVSWWSHDIGGNHGGIEDPELYIRYVQLGVFSPILRFHAARGKYYKREPWRWDIKTLTVADDYLRLRHRLIPYLYTEAYKYYKTGKPIIEPLYYSVPWVYDDEAYKNQYYFGDEMMIAPILAKKDIIMNRTIQRFYVPNGIWYDFNTGKKFPGNKKHVSFFKDEDYPVFVKGGSIVPLSNKSNLNNIGNPSELEIHIFPGANNTYNLYEDDGVTSLYEEGYFLKTEIDYNYLPSNYTVIIRSVEGKKGIVPEFRDYYIRFRNTKEASNVVAYFNSSVIEIQKYVVDNDFMVVVKHVPTVGQLTINCKGTNIEIDAVRVINDDIDSILMDLQINTYLKEKVAEIMFSSLELKKKRIEIRRLKKDGLSKDHIRLFLKLLEYLGEI